MHFTAFRYDFKLIEKRQTNFCRKFFQKVKIPLNAILLRLNSDIDMDRWVKFNLGSDK